MEHALVARVRLAPPRAAQLGEDKGQAKRDHIRDAGLLPALPRACSLVLNNDVSVFFLGIIGRDVITPTV